MKKICARRIATETETMESSYQNNDEVCVLNYRESGYNTEIHRSVVERGADENKYIVNGEEYELNEYSFLETLSISETCDDSENCPYC